MKNATAEIQGFAPIASGEPKILILGSMPSEESLRRQQYYGHARNAFWPIMAELFGAEGKHDYLQRKQMLIDNGIALWDVLKSCHRQGSLDANISVDSIILNDFANFFEQYRRIDRVFFNGGMAESVYKKYILPTLPGPFGTLECRRLPSTSPACASLTFNEKLEAWRVIKQYVIK